MITITDWVIIALFSGGVICICLMLIPWIMNAYESYTDWVDSRWRKWGKQRSEPMRRK